MGKKDKIMRILQVIPKLGYGGAETGCYDLAHYLYEKDCKFNRDSQRFCL